MKVIIAVILLFFSFEGYAQVTAGLKLDSTQTNFKYAATVNNLDWYTENGKNDLANTLAASFQIGVFNKTPIERIKALMNKLVLDYERDGFKVLNKTVAETEINGQKAFVIESKIQNKNKIGITYQVSLIGKNAYAFFRAVAYNNLEIYLAKYKKTVASIDVP